MRRLICFLLCLSLLGGMGAALAVELPDAADAAEFAERIRARWEELEIRERLEDLDMEGIGDDLRALAQESAGLDDEALEARIRALAAKHGVTLDDAQVEKIVKLFRSAEKGAAVKEKAEDAKEKAAGFLQSLRGLAHKAAAFFQKLGALLQKV